MKCLSCLVSATLFAAAAFAQTPASPPASGQAAPPAQPSPSAAPAPMKLTLAAGLRRSYDNIKRNLTEAAEKMPDADFTFKPTPEVRTFGKVFGHVANAQFGACSALKGEPNPNQGTDNELKTTKAEVVKALADSFAYCEGAVSSVTDDTATQLVKQGPNEVARAAILANVIAHGNEMYGTAVVYLRLKGITPPSTERQQQNRRPSHE
jgi:uncharacterized damage-inducible protein DinB